MSSSDLVPELVLLTISSFNSLIVNPLNKSDNNLFNSSNTSSSLNNKCIAYNQEEHKQG